MNPNGKPLWQRSNEVINYLYRREVSSSYTDEVSGNKIRADSLLYTYDGCEESLLAPVMIENQGHKYKVNEQVEKKIKARGQNGKVQFNYLPYLIEVKVDEIKIKTGKEELPTKVRISLKDYDNFDRTKVQLELVVKQNGNEVNRLPLTMEAQQEVLCNLPTKDANKGDKIDFSFIVECVANPEDVEFQTQAVSSYGYKASEKVLEKADYDGVGLFYEGVYQTIKKGEQDPEEELERFNLNFRGRTVKKAGYGFDLDLQPKYEADSQVDLHFRLKLPKEILDSTVDYDNDYRLPQTFVERKTGIVKKDSADLDGGHKIYLPWFLEAKTYEAQLLSDEIGANFIRVDFSHEIEVPGRMLTTKNSLSKNKDDLLLAPIYSGRINIEKLKNLGYSEEAITWFKK
jgi:hypothetical protein